MTLMPSSLLQETLSQSCMCLLYNSSCDELLPLSTDKLRHIGDGYACQHFSAKQGLMD